MFLMKTGKYAMAMRASGELEFTSTGNISLQSQKRAARSLFLMAKHQLSKRQSFCTMASLNSAILKDRQRTTLLMHGST
jgi:hypothetical protein